MTGERRDRRTRVLAYPGTTVTVDVPPDAPAPFVPVSVGFDCSPIHGPDACCTYCTSTTDGRGFPHRSEAKGRRRLQQCPVCGDWVEPSNWVNEPQPKMSADGPAIEPMPFFGCGACHAARRDGPCVG